MNESVETMKTRIIESIDEVHDLLQSVQSAASNSIRAISEIIPSGDMTALWKMKFEQLGFDPIDGVSRLNLIEQLNQSFTYLATIKSLEILFEHHPDLAPFTMNLGTASGSDIESLKPPGVAAEVFAAVTPTNNRKLRKDIEKVSTSEALYKYVFFISPGFAKSRQKSLETNLDVQVWSLGGENEF